VNLEEGARVVLRPNPAEGWPRQEAVVEGTTEMPWGTSVTVRIDEKYRDKDDPDGLREVTADQIWSLNPEDLAEVTRPVALKIQEMLASRRDVHENGGPRALRELDDFINGLLSAYALQYDTSDLGAAMDQAQAVT
jgi:hypothetical protein